MTVKEKITQAIGSEPAQVKLSKMLEAERINKKMLDWLDNLICLSQSALSEESADEIINQLEKVVALFRPDQKSLAWNLTDKLSGLKSPLILTNEDAFKKRLEAIEERLNQIIEPENFLIEDCPEMEEECSLSDLREMIKNHCAAIKNLLNIEANY